MRFHDPFYIGRIAAAHSDYAGNPLPAQWGKYHPVSLLTALKAYFQLTKLIGVEYIGARKEKGKIRPQPLQQRLQLFFEQSQVFVVARAVGQVDIEIGAFLVKGIIVPAVHAEGKD